MFFRTTQISIRLPTPDMHFQRDQPTPMGFLWEALAGQDMGPTSALVECIVLATLCGRAVSHRHQSLMDKTFCKSKAGPAEGFWARHQGTWAILTRRMDLFATNHLPDLRETEPTLLFVSMMWQAVVLHLYQTMDRVVPIPGLQAPAAVELSRHASVAAQEAVGLAANLLRGSYMKVSVAVASVRPAGFDRPPSSSRARPWGN